MLFDWTYVKMKRLYVWPHRHRCHFFFCYCCSSFLSLRMMPHTVDRVWGPLGWKHFSFLRTATYKRRWREEAHCMCVSRCSFPLLLLLLLLFSRLYIGKRDTHAPSLLNRRRRVSERSIKTKKKKKVKVKVMISFASLMSMNSMTMFFFCLMIWKWQIKVNITIKLDFFWIIISFLFKKNIQQIIIKVKKINFIIWWNFFSSFIDDAVEHVSRVIEGGKMIFTLYTPTIYFFSFCI